MAKGKSKIGGSGNGGQSDDWLYLSMASGLFRLVSSKTDPGNCDDEKLSRVTVGQARIFGHIFSHPDMPVRIKNIAHDLDVSPAAASQAVERLVADGMLDRRPDPTDRRAVVITISKKGRKVLDEIKAKSSALLSDVYRDTGLPEADIAAFSRVLSAIHATLVARWREYIARATDGSSAQPSTSGQRETDGASALRHHH